MTLQFTPEEFEAAITRHSLAHGKKLLAVITAVRSSPVYVKGDHDDCERLEKAIGEAMGQHIPDWKELL